MSNPLSQTKSHVYYDSTFFQSPQVVEGSDSGQQPDIDVTSTDSDGPVETHVSNPP